MKNANDEIFEHQRDYVCHLIKTLEHTSENATIVYKEIVKLNAIEHLASRGIYNYN
jgi:hypothetical protein